MLDRVELWSFVLLAVCLGMSSGCNATCIRDSDCLGQSVCSENRCILVVRRDAGTSGTPSNDEASDGGGGGAAGSGASAVPDAGN